MSAYNILSNLMGPLAGLLDVAFLGHLPEICYLAGVALATVIFNFIYWSFGFLRMSTTGLVAQAAGRGDGEEVWRVGLRAMGLAGGLSLLSGLGIAGVFQGFRGLCLACSLAKGWSWSRSSGTRAG